MRILTLRRRPRKVILFLSLHNKTNVNFSTLGLMYTKSDCPNKNVSLMINSDLNLITNKISKKIQYNCGLNFRLSCNMCSALLQMPSYPKCSHGTATSIRVPSRPRICKCTVSESSELQESLTDIDIFGPWIVPKAANSWIGLNIANSEFRTEHFGSEMLQLDKYLGGDPHNLPHNLPLILLI